MDNVITLERSWFQARASDGSDEAEISIYDEIGLWGITAKDFQDELKALGNVQQINLRINSPGGSVFDGVAVYNMLKRHRARVVVTIDGIAASIASVIAMAGDEVLIPANAMMMIHDPAGIVVGTSKEMRDLAAALDKIKQAMISSYAAKSGADREEIAQLMADETWFNADEAVEMGLADRIEEPVQIAAKFDLESRFHKVPTGLVAKARNRKETNMPADTQQTPQGQQPTTPQQQPTAQGQGNANPQQPAAQNPDPAPQQPAQQPSEPPAAQLDPVAAERKRAVDIHAACNLAGQPEAAAAFIADGKEVSTVLAELQSKRAAGVTPAANGTEELSARHQSGAPPALRVDLAADMRRRSGVKN